MRDVMAQGATWETYAHEALSDDDENPVQVDDALVVQADQPSPRAFPVYVDQIVTVRQAPSIAAGAKTMTLLDATTPFQAGNPDPRRSGLTMTSSQPFWYGPRRDIAQSGTGALIPANVPISLTNSDEVWVRGATGNTFPQTIAIINEQWAR